MPGWSTAIRVQARKIAGHCSRKKRIYGIILVVVFGLIGLFIGGVSSFAAGAIGTFIIVVKLVIIFIIGTFIGDILEVALKK